MAIPHSGTVASSGAVRAAPMRCWLALRSVQPRKKWTAPAIVKLTIAHAVRSSIARQLPSGG